MSQVNQAVKSIVNPNLLTCSPTDTISTCAHSMQMKGCSSILVVENGVPIGIWTERDSLQLDVSNLAIFDRPVRDFMTSPVKSIRDDISIGAAAVRFKEEKVRHLLVVDGDSTPIGIITQTDVILKHGEEYYLTLKTVGQTITMTAPVVNADTPFIDAILNIQNAPQAAVCVFFPDHSYGIVTEKDITRFVSQKHFPTTMGDAASRPLATIANSANLLEARHRLIHTGFRHLGVHNDKGEVIGLISFSSILSSLQFEYVRRINTILEERSHALIQSQNSLHLAHKIIEASLDGIIIVNQQGKIEYVNPTFTEVTGYSADEAIGKTPTLLKSGRHGDDYYSDMWSKLSEDGYWQGEIWNRRKNGELYPEWLTITAIKNDQGEIYQYAGIFCDISERKSQENEIRRLAYFDELTKLPNRRLFGDRLQMAIARAKRHDERLAVMFVDLDHFKKINDTLGHNTGDALLVEAAERLVHCTRGEDTVARLGGDEFILMFPDIASIEEVTKVADRIVESFSQPFVIDDKKLFVTSSLGLSIFPDDGEKAEILIKNADAAMYRSKDEGRSTFNLFNPSFTELGMRQLTVESALRGAIKNNEFQLYFQPQAKAQDGTLIAAEALLRWHNDEIGEIGPAEFIPIAEEIGMNIQIGEWVLDQACAQLKEWQMQNHPPIIIAINISPEQITDTSFPKLVEETLKKYDISGACLEIEITEGSFINQPELVRTNLYALKNIGVRIAIDDFGTGYSNLAYLRKLPIDHLKIDQSFIHEMFQEKGNRQLVSTIINMSQSLGMQSVAEGVETKKQAEFLNEGGCSILQGYLLSKPEPAESFARHFKSAFMSLEDDD
ncbi:EAL domain-containing protein [Terasakiella sp. A23]|uniref:EAL domain-containing protein n=1 Tax=Terasakiella sp. FCG-A23 TaxID=3080561 RepID=UPI002955680A|nr:EAL domain-containing protein [Terasakiella sp. A23]MDV7338613.1 EAL domain-containing protein [Terasakiella sp. A23]